MKLGALLDVSAGGAADHNGRRDVLSLRDLDIRPAPSMQGFDHLELRIRLDFFEFTKAEFLTSHGVDGQVIGFEVPCLLIFYPQKDII